MNGPESIKRATYLQLHPFINGFIFDFQPDKIFPVKNVKFQKIYWKIMSRFCLYGAKNFLIPRIMEIPQPVWPQPSSKSRNCCFSSTSSLVSIDFQDGGCNASIVYNKVAWLNLFYLKCNGAVWLKLIWRVIFCLIFNFWKLSLYTLHVSK